MTSDSITEQAARALFVSDRNDSYQPSEKFGEAWDSGLVPGYVTDEYMRRARALADAGLLARQAPATDGVRFWRHPEGGNAYAWPGIDSDPEALAALEESGWVEVHVTPVVAPATEDALITPAEGARSELRALLSIAAGSVDASTDYGRGRRDALDELTVALDARAPATEDDAARRERAVVAVEIEPTGWPMGERRERSERIVDVVLREVSQ